MTGSFKISLAFAASVALLTACGNTSVSDLNSNPSDDASTTSTPNPTATPPGPSFSFATDKATIDTDIGLNTQTVGFTVTPNNGFTGAVTIHATNVPAGVTIADVVATVVDASPVTGSMVIDASDWANSVPGAYNTITLNAAATGGLSATPAPLTVNLLPTIHIATKNIGTSDTATDYFGGEAASGGARVHLGNATSVTLMFKNTSGIQHRIHRGGDTDGGLSGAKVNGTQNANALNAAINHSNGGDGMPNTEWSMVVTPKDVTAATTQVDFYCHIHGLAKMPGAVTIVP